MKDSILFVHRFGDTNVGDQLASPMDYFFSGHPQARRVEVHVPFGSPVSPLKRLRLQELKERAGTIIVGGGGLLGNDYFAKDIEFWSNSPAPVILWGAGHNAHDPLAVASALPDETGFHQLIRFSAIGLRDFERGFEWVPCASCMHPGLDGPFSETGGTLFLMHRDLRRDPQFLARLAQAGTPDIEVIFNDEQPDKVFGKLRAAARVVTNSYHGAYWASLLGKPVVAVGGGTKIAMLKHKVPTGTLDTWQTQIKDAPVYPHALEECRDRNSTFHALVRGFLDSPRAASRPYRRDTGVEMQEEARAFGTKAPAVLNVKVPKVVHFVFGLSPDFGGKPFNIMHYVAVRSVMERFEPEEIIFHHEYEPQNEFFERVKGLMTLRKVRAPTEYGGRKISHFAHRADILRLEALRDFGGLYLDLDTITVRPFDHLLNYSFSIGLQGISPVEGLCNAVMAAAPKDRFVTDWLGHYDNFSDSNWDLFSVKLPYLKWRSRRYDINVEPYDRFHWPLWDKRGLSLMFEQRQKFPNAVCHHLWESKSFPKYFANESFEASVKRVRRMNNSYSDLAQSFL